jgi:hypothetical protein
MSTVLSQHYLHRQWRTSCCNCLYKVWAHKSSFTFYFLLISLIFCVVFFVDFFFILCLCQILPVSLDCPFMIGFLITFTYKCYTGNDGHRVAIVCIRFGHIKVVSLFIEVSVPNLCQDMRGGCHVFLQTSDLSIGHNLISTCACAYDWLPRGKCICWWIIFCSNLAG